MNRAARPAGPAADSARLQPDETVELDEWLKDPEFDRAADALRRLGADEEIILNLQLNNFADAVWKPVAQELARYGFAVIRSWIRRTTIFGKVRSRTSYRLSMLDGWPTDDDVVNDLATDTVISALQYFKDHILMEGKWDPRQGASLRTYFIGQCLFQFPNHYRSQYDAEIKRRKTELLTGDDSDLDELMGSIRGIEQTVVAKAELAAVLAGIKNERLSAALVLHYQFGYSYEEISGKLGMSGAKQVENMISYQRTQMRRKTS